METLIIKWVARNENEVKSIQGLSKMLARLLETDNHALTALAVIKLLKEEDGN